jgi:uncharacterized membrane protein YoaK (UPF0700 family)
LDQSKIKAPAISSNTRDFLFVVLTCVAGSVDALSVFGLGGVFTSLLSGNTIVLAAYLVQGHSMKALLAIFVFVGYIPGAALAAFFLKQEKHNTEWTKRVTQTLGIEAIFLMILVVGTYFSHNYSSFNMYLVFLAAVSMGIQYTCAKQVNRIGVITTMVTGTLSSLVSRLVDRSKDTGLRTAAAHEKREHLYPNETTVFLGAFTCTTVAECIVSGYTSAHERGSFCR